MLLVVLADTHVRDGSAGDLPRAVWDAVDGCDLVLHAGDVTGGALLERIRERVPLYAVLGNNDHGLAGALPERWIDGVGGARIAMVHDAGPRSGRGARVRRWFPDADLVVFGHSHEPFAGFDAGMRLFNPGSPTQRRRQPFTTYGVVEIVEGRVIRTVIERADV